MREDADSGISPARVWIPASLSEFKDVNHEALGIVGARPGTGDLAVWLLLLRAVVVRFSVWWRRLCDGGLRRSGISWRVCRSWRKLRRGLQSVSNALGQGSAAAMSTWLTHFRPPARHKIGPRDSPPGVRPAVSPYSRPICRLPRDAVSLSLFPFREIPALLDDGLHELPAQGGINAAVCQELPMRPPFDNAPLLQHEDEIGVADGA